MDEATVAVAQLGRESAPTSGGGPGWWRLPFFAARRGWAVPPGRVLAVVVPFLVFVRLPHRLSDAVFLALIIIAWVAVQSLLFRVLTVALGTGLAMIFAAGVALTVALLLQSAHLLPESFGRIALLEAAASIFALSVAWELVASRCLTASQRVLVVGTSSTGMAIVEETQRERCSRFTVVGFVGGDDDVEPPMAGRRAPFLGRLGDLPEVVDAQRPDLIVLAAGDSGRVVDLLLEADWRSFRVAGAPHFFEDAFGRVPVEHITPAWFMSILHFRRSGYGARGKRIFDLVVGLTMLVLLLPVILLVAFCVRTTGRPLLYRQTRLGERGQTFEMLKFRTMGVSAESSGQATWAAENDPRVTKIGRVLRRSHLDEIPQLWNVLRGEMSLVGPRPERPEFVRLLESEIPYWNRRLLLKPGLTGWAQLHAGYADSSGTASRKLAYDLWYLRHRTLLLDLGIVARTVLAVASGAGSR